MGVHARADDLVVLQDSTGASTAGAPPHQLQPSQINTINSLPVLQTKLAEKRKIIEEIAHNDVKKVSLFRVFFSFGFVFLFVTYVYLVTLVMVI